MDFFGILISPLGGWPVRFLHTLQIEQGLLAHTAEGSGSPKIFRANI